MHLFRFPHFRALPIELVDSKNRKKMATASSDTTLTDRSGCVERTFEATNCTQMLSEIRCEIVTSNVMNCMIPEGPRALSSSVPFLAPSLFASLPEADRARITSAYCLLNPTNVDGNAAKRTDTSSTTAMSSSSDMCASCAAPSNSCAMPRETENARSEPRDPIATEVAMRKATLLPTASQVSTLSSSATSSELRYISSECCCLSAVLASQRGLSLPIRHLFICPIVNTSTNGRGGKVLRERIGSTHKHWYSGEVFGCLIGPAIDFVRHADQRMADVIRTLYNCLHPAGRDIMSCYGADAVHIQRGFASYHVIRGQLAYLSESKTSCRIDSRYGKKSIVLGVSVCMYFVLYSLLRNEDNSSSVSLMSRQWLVKCWHTLSMWKSRAHSGGIGGLEPLEAERRAICRGEVALKRAQEESFRLELNTKSAARFELECMRKAMWPASRRIDAETQEELILWIQGGDFFNDVPIDTSRRNFTNFNVNLPLSAISLLPGRHAREDSEDGSVCGSISSASSWSSVSSGGSVPENITEFKL